MSRSTSRCTSWRASISGSSRAASLSMTSSMIVSTPRMELFWMWAAVAKPVLFCTSGSQTT